MMSGSDQYLDEYAIRDPFRLAVSAVDLEAGQVIVFHQGPAGAAALPKYRQGRYCMQRLRRENPYSQTAPRTIPTTYMLKLVFLL
jgi:hypothetical protein